MPPGHDIISITPKKNSTTALKSKLNLQSEKMNIILNDKMGKCERLKKQTMSYHVEMTVVEKKKIKSQNMDISIYSIRE